MKYIYICVYKWYSFFRQWGHAVWVLTHIISCCVGVDIYHILLCGCSHVSHTAVWAFAHMNNCCVGVDTYVYCFSRPHWEHKWYTASFHLTKNTHTARAWKSGAAGKNFSKAGSLPNVLYWVTIELTFWEIQSDATGRTDERAGQGGGHNKRLFSDTDVAGELGNNCNTLKHTHHAATRCNAICISVCFLTRSWPETPVITAPHCNTLHHAATHYNALQRYLYKQLFSDAKIAGLTGNTLQCAATRCNTLQHHHHKRLFPDAEVARALGDILKSQKSKVKKSKVAI